MEEWNEKHSKRDVSDAEWAFVAPYLTLMTEEEPTRNIACEKCSMACAEWCVRGQGGD